MRIIINEIMNDILQNQIESHTISISLLKIKQIVFSIKITSSPSQFFYNI